MSDLSALFPDIAHVLNEFDNPRSNSALSSEVNEAVTVEDVDAYISGMTDRILRPAVSAQQTPGNAAPFARNGVPAPSPTESVVEPPATPTAGTESAPSAPSTPADSVVPPSPGESEAAASSETPPATTTDASAPEAPESATAAAPAPASTAPDTVLINGQQIPITVVAEMIQFRNAVMADPRLQQHLISYYQSQAQAPVAQAPGTGTPTLPDISPEDLSDPAIRALYERVQAQQAQIEQARQIALQSQRAANDTQSREIRDIVDSAKSSFQSKYQIPADLMPKLEAAAAGSNAVLTYMRGMDPRTMTPVANPNQHDAVTAALEMAFYIVPETRQLDWERRQQRAQSDAARKAKLAGVGGSSGSVPRTPPPASDPREAMTREVAQMFNGTWASPR